MYQVKSYTEKLEESFERALEKAIAPTQTKKALHRQVGGNSQEVVWKSVPLYEDYEVSNFGDLRSYKPYRNNAPKPNAPRAVLKHRDKHGYWKASLYNQLGRKDFMVHSLVLSTFSRPKKDGEVCRHLDGDRTNNSLENLCWGTPKENSQDSKNHGTDVKGSLVNTSVLSETDVLEIRRLADISFTDLAKKYGVTPTTIRNAYLGITWKHV